MEGREGRIKGMWRAGLGGGEWGRLGGVKVIAILTDFKREEAEVVWKQEINCWGVLIRVCLYRG